MPRPLAKPGPSGSPRPLITSRSFSYPVDLVLEVTGQAAVLDDLLRANPPGVEVMGAGGLRFFWDLLAHQAAMTLENARLLEETDRRAREQAALTAIATAVSQSLRLNELLRIAFDKVLEVTGREHGYIRLKDPVTGKITLAAHRGISQEHIEALLDRRTPGGKTDRVFASGQPLVVNDPERELLKGEARREKFQAIAWIPLKVRGGVLGILNVATSRPVPFVPREVDLLQAIGNMIGVAVENARLRGGREGRRARECRLCRLASASESFQRAKTIFLTLGRAIVGAEPLPKFERGGLVASWPWRKEKIPTSGGGGPGCIEDENEKQDCSFDHKGRSSQFA